MKPISTCVLGTGLSGLTFHVPFVLALPNLFTLHSVLERHAKSEGGKLKERFGVSVKIYTTISEVVADPEIELVIVGTPNTTHYEYIKRSLEAGKHVLVDKPVVPSSAQAKELSALAKSKKLVLYAYQNRRWDSDFLAVKRLLAETSTSPTYIGDIVEFESHFDRYRSQPKGNWRDENVPGSGQLYDLGTHLIDQVVSLFGRPQKVTGFTQNIRLLGNPSVDDAFTVYLHYPSNSQRKYALTAILRAHILSAREYQLRYLIRGTKGSFTKYGLDVQEEQLKAISDPSDIFNDDFGQEPDDIVGEVEIADNAGKIVKTTWPSNKGAYAELFKNLAGAIRDKEDVKIDWDNEVVTVLEIIEAAHESSRTGRTVAL